MLPRNRPWASSCHDGLAPVSLVALANRPRPTACFLCLSLSGWQPWFRAEKLDCFRPQERRAQRTVGAPSKDAALTPGTQPGSDCPPGYESTKTFVVRWFIPGWTRRTKQINLLPGSRAAWRVETNTTRRPPPLSSPCVDLVSLRLRASFSVAIRRFRSPDLGKNPGGAASSDARFGDGCGGPAAAADQDSGSLSSGKAASRPGDER
jgi:hypothetical protein